MNPLRWKLEGADNVFEGALDNFSSKKIILRETSATKHKYTNKEVTDITDGGILAVVMILSFTDDGGNDIDTKLVLVCHL